MSMGSDVGEYDQYIHGYISLGNTATTTNIKVSFEGDV